MKKVYLVASKQKGMKKVYLVARKQKGMKKVYLVASKHKGMAKVYLVASKQKGMKKVYLVASKQKGMKKHIEDNKVVIRSRKSKNDRQCNDQMKRNKRPYHDLDNRLYVLCFNI